MTLRHALHRLRDMRTSHEHINLTLTIQVVGMRRWHYLSLKNW